MKSRHGNKSTWPTVSLRREREREGERERERATVSGRQEQRNADLVTGKMSMKNIALASYGSTNRSVSQRTNQGNKPECGGRWRGWGWGEKLPTSSFTTVHLFMLLQL